MDKRTLRREIGEKKRTLSGAEIERRSAALAAKLYETAQYRQAASLYAYLSYNQEVRTRPIIERAWADGKRVAAPKVFGDEMRFIWIDSFEQVAPRGPFGIEEPLADGPVADDARAGSDARAGLRQGWTSRRLRRRLLRPVSCGASRPPPGGAVLRFPAVRPVGDGSARRARAPGHRGFLNGRRLKKRSSIGTYTKHTMPDVKPPLYRLDPPCMAGMLVTRQ